MSKSGWSRLPEILLRLVGFLFLGAVAAGLGWLVWVVLGVPVGGARPWSVFFLKSFFLLLVGGIGVGSFGLAIECLRGLWWRPSTFPGRVVPEVVARLCPGCGEARAPGAVCACCGVDPGAAGASWASQSGAEPGMNLLMSAIFLGILNLGLFMGSEALTDIKLGLGVRIAYLLLAALMASVGGGALIGNLFLWYDTRRLGVAFSYHQSSHGPDRSTSVNARARVLRRELLDADGSVTQSKSLPAQAAGDFPGLTPEMRDFIRLLAAFQRENLASFHLLHVRSWRLPRSPEPAPDASFQGRYREAAPAAEVPAEGERVELKIESWCHDGELSVSTGLEEAMEWLCERTDADGGTLRTSLLLDPTFASGVAEVARKVRAETPAMREPSDPWLDADEATLAVALVEIG